VLAKIADDAFDDRIPVMLRCRLIETLGAAAAITKGETQLREGRRVRVPLRGKDGEAAREISERIRESAPVFRRFPTEVANCFITYIIDP